MTDELAVILPPLPATFDPALTIEQRAESLYWLLHDLAALSMEREELEHPDVPWLPQADDTPERTELLPDIRESEARRRVGQYIQDLRQITNRAELYYAIQNGGERWLNAEGQETSLLEELEHQMPDEEQRASSGRARQVWSFLDTAQAMRETGIHDWDIARCNSTGVKSVLGIVAHAQREIERTTAPQERRDKYQRLIELAETPVQNLKQLKRTITKELLPNGEDEPPPIPYSLEVDGTFWWFIARPTHDQFTSWVLGKLGNELELSIESLAQAFYRFWQAQM